MLPGVCCAPETPRYQGRSFQAFYEFLPSKSRQEELTDLLASDTVDEERRIRSIHHDWSEAAERAHAPSCRSRSSCADSSTTRSGWRTVASSIWCEL